MPRRSDARAPYVVVQAPQDALWSSCRLPLRFIGFQCSPHTRLRPAELSCNPRRRDVGLERIAKERSLTTRQKIRQFLPLVVFRFGATSSSPKHDARRTDDVKSINPSQHPAAFFLAASSLHQVQLRVTQMFDSVRQVLQQDTPSCCFFGSRLRGGQFRWR